MVKISQVRKVGGEGTVQRINSYPKGSNCLEGVSHSCNFDIDARQRKKGDSSTMVFEDLLLLRCLYLLQLRDGKSEIHGSVKIASEMMNCEGKEREIGGSSDGAGKAIISAGRASEI